MKKLTPKQLMVNKISKIDLWFYHFTNEGCPETFLNKTGSARKAGYKTDKEGLLADIGYQNSIKLYDRISKWIDESGLSDAKLKLKMLNLLEAKETKFFQKDGKVIEQVDVEAIETQRRTLDMAMKVKGMYEKDNLQKKSDIENILEKIAEKAEDAIRGLNK